MTDQSEDVPLVYRISCRNQVSWYFNVARLLWFLCDGVQLPPPFTQFQTFKETVANTVLPSCDPSVLTFGQNAAGKGLERTKSRRTTQAWTLFIDIVIDEADDQFELANAMLLVQNHQEELKSAHGKVCIRIWPRGRALYRVKSFLWSVARNYPGVFQILNENGEYVEPSEPSQAPNESWPCLEIGKADHGRFSLKVAELKKEPQANDVQKILSRLRKLPQEESGGKLILSAVRSEALRAWLVQSEEIDSGLGGMTYLGLIVFEMLLRNSISSLREWISAHELESGTQISTGNTDIAGPSLDTGKDIKILVDTWLAAVVDQAKEISEALWQAVDNIHRHSRKKQGLLLFRVVNSGKESNKDQRDRNILKSVHRMTPNESGQEGYQEDSKRFIIATVLDYAPKSLSLSDTFVRELKEEKPPVPDWLLKDFEDCLTPRGFFDPNDSEVVSFSDYRQDPDNPDRVSLHRGFQSIRKRVRRLDADLIVESHTSPISGNVPPQEHWCTKPTDWYITPPSSESEDEPGLRAKDADKRMVSEDRLPGTRLTVVMPLTIKVNPRPSQVILDQQVPYDLDVAQTKDWVCTDQTHAIIAHIQTAVDKGNPVISLADSLRKQISVLEEIGAKDSKDQVFVINGSDPKVTEFCQDHGKHPGELFAKAVTAAVGPSENAARKVRAIGFYRCDDRFRRVFHGFMENLLESPFDSVVSECAFDCVLLPEVPPSDPNQPNVGPTEPEVDIYRVLASETESKEAAADGNYRWHRSGELTWGWSQFYGNSVPLTVRWEQWEQQLVVDKSKAPLPYHLLLSYALSTQEAFFSEEVAVTHFEHTLPTILNREITDTGLGCRHRDVHIRLGSTVHLDTFYEAEQLFSIPRFARAFAFLLVKKMIKEWAELPTRLLAYGYATYSERLLREVKSLMESLNQAGPTKYEVNHVVYERSSEDGRGDQGDGLRPTAQDLEPKVKEGDKILLVVPIGTTLKTTFKMLKTLQDELRSVGLIFDKLGEENLLCSTLIAVGVGSPANVRNPYWEAKPGQRKLTPPSNSDDPTTRVVGRGNARDNSVVNIHYLVSTDAKYYYPFPPDSTFHQCFMCFPEKPCDEWPLVETNRISVVPMLTADPRSETTNEDTPISSWITEGLRSLAPLVNNVRYPHFERDGHEYEYYFDTQDIAQNRKEDIKAELKRWSDNHPNASDPKKRHYLIIPSHHRAQAFLECVEETIFSDLPVQVITLDAENDQRSTVKTRHAWIRQDLESLDKDLVCFHFVNDTVSSGRTLLRARSLMRTLLPHPHCQDPNVFSFYYHLIETRSSDTWAALLNLKETEDVPKQAFSYIHLDVPHLRHGHGQCRWCKEREKAAHLMRQSVNSDLVKNYRHRQDKTKRHGLTAKLNPSEIEWSKPDQPDVPAVVWRRLFCTHVAMNALRPFFGEKLVRTERQPSRCQQAEEKILELLSFDVPSRIDELKKAASPANLGERGEQEHVIFEELSKMHGNQKAEEYLYSFIEALTRSPMTDHRVVRTSIFRIVIGMLDYLVTGQEGTALSPNLRAKLDEIKMTHKNHEECPGFGNQEAHCPLFHIVHLLLSRLEGLPSTYLFRPKYAFTLRTWINENFDELTLKKLGRYQMAAIKGVTHGTTDTSWSAWLDRELTACLDWDPLEKDGTGFGRFSVKEGCTDLACDDNAFLRDLFIENNRVFYEAVDHLVESPKLWTGGSTDYLDQLTSRNESERGAAKKAVCARISSMLDYTNDSYDDYKLGNAARCLSHMLDPTHAWRQDTNPRCYGCAKPSQSGNPLPELLLWPAAILRFLRISFRKPGEHDVSDPTSESNQDDGNGDTDTASQLSFRNSPLSITFKNRLDRLLILMMESFGGSIRSASLGGFFDPPYEQFEPRQIYVPITAIETFQNGAVSKASRILLTSFHSRPSKDGSQWDIVSVPWPSGAFSGVVIGQGGESEQGQRYVAPYFFSAQYHHLRQVKGEAFPKTTWSEPSRLRLLLMLRHTLEDRVFGEVHRGVIEQLLHDEWLAGILMNAKSRDHASATNANNWHRILTAGLDYVSTTLLHQRNADKTISDLFVSAAQNKWEGREITSISGQELQEALGPGITRPSKGGNDKRLEYQPPTLVHTVSFDYDEQLTNAKIEILTAPVFKASGVNEFADLLLTVGANAFKYGKADANGKVTITVGIDGQDPSLLSMSYPVKRSTGHNPNEALEQLHGALSTQGESPISLWTLGQYVRHVLTLAEPDKSSQKWATVREEDQSDTTFTLLIPLVIPQQSPVDVA